MCIEGGIAPHEICTPGETSGLRDKSLGACAVVVVAGVLLSLTKFRGSELDKVQSRLDCPLAVYTDLPLTWIHADRSLFRQLEAPSFSKSPSQAESPLSAFVGQISVFKVLSFTVHSLLYRRRKKP